MAKSAILNVENNKHVSTSQALRRKAPDGLFLDSTRLPLDKAESVLPVNLPAPQVRPFSDVTKLVGRFAHFDLRSTSPAPSDGPLQPLVALRSSIQRNTDGHNDACEPYSENAPPVIHCKHFLEVEDTKHRYGTYLLPYYDIWMDTGSTDPFFMWLDEGEGRYMDASKIFRSRPHCVPRQVLDDAMVYYCTEEEREQYRVILCDGNLVWANERSPNCGGKNSLVNTTKEDRWIFVIDEDGNFFLNKKSKGRFHHSSFVAGRPVRAAGRIIVEIGDIVSIGPNSGHYLTTQDQLLRAIDYFFGHSVEDVSALCGRNSFEMDRP